MEGGGGRLVEIGLTGERERMSSSRLAAAGLQSEGGRTKLESNTIAKTWPKTTDYSKAFEQIALHTHNSSLEGVTKLKSVSFCSS